MKIKAVVSDMDGCLVSYSNEPYNSSWDAISEVLLDNREWIALRDYYINKEEKYLEWFERQTGLLRGLSIERAERALFPIPYSKGVIEFFNSLDGTYIKGIVSSGVNIVAERAKKELGLDFQVSNFLEVADGIFIGKGEEKVGLNNKLEILSNVLREYGIKLNEVCFDGDNFNDVPVFEEVGLSTAYNPKTKEIAEKANYVIYDYRELNNILEILK